MPPWPNGSDRKNLKIAIGAAAAVVMAVGTWLSSPSLSPSPSAASASVAPEPAPASSAVAAASDPAQAPVAAPQPPAATTAAHAANAAPQLQAPARKALPEVARTGGRWLKALPADTLVVEHGTFPNLEQIQKFQAKHKPLGTARIVAVRKTTNATDWQFALISGPFRSEDRAKTYVSRLDWRANTRIRDTDKLKPLVVSAP
jgi:septal ring-binding cell division protein DamX